MQPKLQTRFLSTGTDTKESNATRNRGYFTRSYGRNSYALIYGRRALVADRRQEARSGDRLLSQGGGEDGGSNGSSAIRAPGALAPQHKRMSDDPKIRQFADLTGADDATATQALAAADGDLDQALAQHFDTGDEASPRACCEAVSSCGQTRGARRFHLSQARQGDEDMKSKSWGEGRAWAPTQQLRAMAVAPRLRRAQLLTTRQRAQRPRLWSTGAMPSASASSSGQTGSRSKM